MIMVQTLRFILAGVLITSIIGCGEAPADLTINESPNNSSALQSASTGSLVNSVDVVEEFDIPANYSWDILWVIDNSASMKPYQAKLAANLKSFIDEFITKNADFRMAFTTTDAYMSSPSTAAAYKTGNSTTNHGVAILTPETPNLADKFITSVSQGLAGSGSERPAESIRAAITSPLNQKYNFPDPNSFLSVVILSDEDDQSRLWSNRSGPLPTDPSIANIEFINFLNSYMNVSSGNSRYQISVIGRATQSCVISGYPLTSRLLDLASRGKGYTGNVCDDFASVLRNISKDNIGMAKSVKLNQTSGTTVFIQQIIVNGVIIPESVTNGWELSANTFTITFRGQYVPPPGAHIKVQYRADIPTATTPTTQQPQQQQ